MISDAVAQELLRMLWVLIGLGSLFFIQKYLGGGLITFLKTLGEEFRSLPNIFGARGALNLAGGIVLAVIAAAFYVFDTVGKLSKIGASPSADADVVKAFVFIGALFFIGLFFILCTWLVGRGKDES